MLGRTLLTLTVAVFLAGCGPDPDDLLHPSSVLLPFLSTDGPSTDAVELPTPSDWSDHGEILTAGRANQWDRYLWGGFAATVVVRSGRTFLYYQGADGYDETEGTVTHRAVGVAVSDDGFDFTKYVHNPVLTWSPTGAIEEGAASAAALLDPAGSVHLFYGANTAISSSEVNADGRWALSTDGFAFDDGGIALDHADARFWGAGDELFPVIAFRENATWYVYYIPNGTAGGGKLAVAWGDEPTSLQESAPVRASSSYVEAWGPSGWAKVGPSLYAFFVSSRGDTHVAGWHMDVYLVDANDPSVFTGPVHTYAFDNMVSGTVHLDRNTSTWYLYYRSADAPAYGVRTAPFVERAIESPAKGPVFTHAPQP